MDDSLSPGLQPFLEISVLVDGPEPQLQGRILAALEGKKVRLTRIAKVRAGSGEGDAMAAAGEDLAELEPEKVFQALFRRQYGDAPPDALLRAFETLLVQVQTSGEQA